MTNVVEIEEAIASVASLLGLLLALVTLFTSELARRLSDERTRTGGSRSETMRTIGISSWALLVVTLASALVLAPLVTDAVSTCCAGTYRPVLWAFVLVWLLLIPLMVWQWSVARSASSTSRAQ
jgi:hypothetical protein